MAVFDAAARTAVQRLHDRPLVVDLSELSFLGSAAEAVADLTPRIDPDRQ